jgi:hypothetical protein
VVENIKAQPKGEPSIGLVISSAATGEITADAVDMGNPRGEHQTLNVSLKSLDEENSDSEIPDFELEPAESFSVEPRAKVSRRIIISDDENQSPPAGLYEKATKVKESERNKFPWIIVICIALIVAALGLLLWIFLFRGKTENVRQSTGTTASATVSSQPAQPQTPPPAQVTQVPVTPSPTPPPVEVKPPEPVIQVPPPPPPVIKAPETPPPVDTTPVSRKRPVPPVASYKVPTVIPRGGAPYRIRWGDTLWDISAAFYRTPWLYSRIARFNNIRNPDLIISGRTIRIPPRN